MLQIFAHFFCVVFFVAVTLEPEVANAGDQFDVTSMPQGAQVTLPRAAKILTPLSVPVRLSSTDSPQTISLAAQSPNARNTSAFKIAIFDPRQDRVRYVDLKAGATPVLYTFRGLSTIQIVPQITPTLRTAANMSQLRLRIESDKPVAVSR